jgi:hypothetical protein
VEEALSRLVSNTDSRLILSIRHAQVRLEYDLLLKSLNPIRRIRELVQELRRAREEGERARRRIEQLEQEKQRLEEWDTRS